MQFGFDVHFSLSYKICDLIVEQSHYIWHLNVGFYAFATWQRLRWHFVFALFIRSLVRSFIRLSDLVSLISHE